jgi:tRNA U34 2-thiouridine synthase MnmA/TrmU
VLATDPASNTVTAGPRTALLADSVPLRDVFLHRDADCVDAVKLRYRGRRLRCRVPGDLDAGGHPRAQVELAQPAERTAPGQVACLYSGELIVGRGTIAAPAAP